MGLASQRVKRERYENVLILMTKCMKKRDIASQLNANLGTIAREIRFLQAATTLYLNNMIGVSKILMQQEKYFQKIALILNTGTILS